MRPSTTAVGTMLAAALMAGCAAPLLDKREPAHLTKVETPKRPTMASEFYPGLNPCYRNEPTFARNHAPNQDERIEAQRWLAYEPVCESYLKDKIKSVDDEVHANAAAGKADKAADTLEGYQNALWSAQIDRHEAYNVIRDELHDELDSRLWNEQLMVAGSLLGGAGDARLAELDFRWELRLHDPTAKRYGDPVGFKYALSVGIASGKNLVSYDSGILNSRDDRARISLPLSVTLSWAWVKSFIFVSGGGAWVQDASPAVLGQVGVGFLQNWLDDTDQHGFVSDARFVVEGWQPLDNHSAFSVLFGFQIGLGLGAGRQPLERYHEEPPPPERPAGASAAAQPQPPAGGGTDSKKAGAAEAKSPLKKAKHAAGSEKPPVAKTGSPPSQPSLTPASATEKPAPAAKAGPPASQPSTTPGAPGSPSPAPPPWPAPAPAPTSSAPPPDGAAKTVPSSPGSTVKPTP